MRRLPANRTRTRRTHLPTATRRSRSFPAPRLDSVAANASWSKLQDMQPGDWLLTNAGSQNENLVLLSATYNSATNIDLWLLRWAAHNYLAPLFPGKDDLSEQRACEPLAAVHGADLCDECGGAGRVEPNQYLDQEQSSALLFAWVFCSRRGGGCGLRIPISKLGLAEAISAASTPRCRIYCGALW